MKSIMQNERACYLTGYTGDLHKHHIYGGNGRRRICEAHGFWCYLRPDLHNLSDQGVHFNHELDLQLMSTPTRKCHFSPEWNVVFWWSACGEYAALITYYLPA